MRKKLKDEEKKARVIITINPTLNKIISELTNKSKYIENLVYQDLLKQNKIEPKLF